MPDLTKTMRLDELKNRFIEGARFTIGKMQRELGVTRRTANRDILDLQSMGLDLKFEELPDGQRQWFAACESRKVRVTYSIRDVMSLFLGRRMFDFLERTSLEESFNRVYHRVETQLSKPKDLNTASKLMKKVYLVHEGPKKLPKRAVDILDEVLSGLLHEHRVGVCYVNHKGETTRFTISPYTLVAYKRGLYILGAVAEWGGKPFIFSLERMKSAVWKRGEAFEYPEDFDPESFFEKALFIAPGEPAAVELIFTEGTRPFIAFRKFHTTERRKDLPNGRLRMTLKVPVNFETVNWILSFGSNVEVVSPPELRDMVRSELEKALAQYR